MSKEIKYLVIHCTATPEGRAVTSKDIRAWHTAPKPKGRGWKQVGYADMIHLYGKIENLVPYDDGDIVDAWEITNGVAGINSLARHVVYVGGLDKKRKPKDTRTSEQKEMLLIYVHKTIESHPKIKIGGHNYFDNGKACPSFNVAKWLRENGIDEKNIL
jgi:hypothetical protein